MTKGSPPIGIGIVLGSAIIQLVRALFKFANNQLVTKIGVDVFGQGRSGWGLIGRGVKFVVGSWRRGDLVATSGEHWIFGI